MRVCRTVGGFSLLEIVVALALAMLILGAATLAIGSVNEEHRIRKAGGAVETAARVALLDAVSEKQDQILVFDKGTLVSPKSGREIELPKPEIFVANQWKQPAGFGWKFLASGICEPIQLRLRTDGAEMEMTFDPLTGEAIEETVTVFR